jgi:hypothetical protein
VFWKNKHGTVFPPAIPTQSVIILVVIDVLLGLGLFLLF